MIMNHKKLIFSLLSLLLVLGSAKAADGGGSSDEAIMASQQFSYPLTTCVVSGEEFTAESPAFSFVISERLVRTCCEDCAAKVKKDPARYIAKLDQAVIEQQGPLYPFTTCMVSGEALDSMGKPIELVYNSRLVRLCCKGCVKSFKKSPDKFLAKIDAAMMAKQLESYPFETCIVSGEGLDVMGEPIDRMYGTTLVRFCCKGCIKEFEKDPAPFLAKIHDARAKLAK